MIEYQTSPPSEHVRVGIGQRALARGLRYELLVLFLSVMPPRLIVFLLLVMSVLLVLLAARLVLLVPVLLVLCALLVRVMRLTKQTMMKPGKLTAIGRVPLQQCLLIELLGSLSCRLQLSATHWTRRLMHQAQLVVPFLGIYLPKCQTQLPSPPAARFVSWWLLLLKECHSQHACDI